MEPAPSSLADVFWAGVVVGALATGVIGGPLSSRWSARVEASWDRAGDGALAASPRLRDQVARLAEDDALFSAYLRQYWTWATVVGGMLLAAGVVGILLVWVLARFSEGFAVATAGLVAAVVGGGAMFWGRKLVAKRRIVRLVYRRRLG